MDIEYLSWRITDISKIVTHPTNESNAGGIIHLSKEKQGRTLNSIEAPPHLCCYDPEFRFRLNQDTLVDINKIIYLLLRTSSTFKNDRKLAKGRRGITNLYHELIYNVCPFPNIVMDGLA